MGHGGEAAFFSTPLEAAPNLRSRAQSPPLKAQEFFLILSSTSLAFRRCELIWVDGAQVGVHFVTGKAKGKAIAEKRLVGSQ